MSILKPQIFISMTQRCVITNRYIFANVAERSKWNQFYEFTFSNLISRKKVLVFRMSDIIIVFFIIVFPRTMHSNPWVY